MRLRQVICNCAVCCAVILAFAFARLTAVSARIQTAPSVTFVKAPPARVLVATPVNFEWRGSKGGLEYRYKLTVPGDWKAGVRYLVNRWSDWSAIQSVSFKDFIVAGTYTLSVQARVPRLGALSPIISHRFAVYFEMPELFEEAVRIDWAAARRAPSKKDRYDILAREFAAAHRAWRQKFDYQLRLLKSTVNPQEFIDTLVRVPVKESAMGVLRWADEGVAVKVGALLKPAKLYGLLKQAGRDVILLFRNIEANRAACMVILTEYAQRGFEYLASQEATASTAHEQSIRKVVMMFLDGGFMRWQFLESTDFPSTVEGWQRRLPFLSKRFIKSDLMPIADSTSDIEEAPRFSNTSILNIAIQGAKAKVKVITSLSSIASDETTRMRCTVSLVLEGGRWRADDFTCGN